MEGTNAKHKRNVESFPNQEERSQNKVIEEVHFFHPVQLSEESGEVLDEKETEKSKVEIAQNFQELLSSLGEETLQLSEFFDRGEEVDEGTMDVVKDSLKAEG